MDSPVLILGAGINGAALARELALNGVSVTVVDTADLASGATAYSSRLIHGGLRYLEYGEFDLVRESLAERTRLLRLAPQFVRPLRLFIPVRRRLGGLVPAVCRFLGWEGKSAYKGHAERGLWLVRLGLRLYDAYARDPSLPRYEVHRANAPHTPRTDAAAYRWECAYWDAQIRYPERFVIALFHDARLAAAETGAAFELLTYHQVRAEGPRVVVSSAAGPARSFTPRAVVNATGAWVDRTLERLQVASRKLMGGTKGSHLFTHNARLREALGGDGLYGEAADGRPVFVLPFGEGTLIGTTDERYEGDPRDAIASEHERRYLLDTVNALVPSAQLTDADIDLHYSGVRPLPAVDSAHTAAITRRHWLEEHPNAPWPLYSVIGGKLTTCRSLAQDAAATILKKLSLPLRGTSADRLLPGAEGFPGNEQTLASLLDSWQRETKFTPIQLRAMWPLVGMEIKQFFLERDEDGYDSVPGTDLPVSFVRWIIHREWITQLEDLVERRLMLLYVPRLSTTTLTALAEILDEVRPSQVPIADQVHRARQRLLNFYGRKLKT